jgi:hypothetical protein
MKITVRHYLCQLLFLLVVLSIESIAYAQTDEIQVYDAEINEPGKFNLVWHNNYTPNGRTEPDFPGGIVPNRTLNGVPEWAYGVTDWLEFGLYLPLYSITDGGRFKLDGAKIRTLFVVPHAKDRSFFYGVNFELSWNASHWERKRNTAEIRPIIGTHIGQIDIILNPILDTTFNGIRELDFAPAMRVAYNFNQTWTAALEQYSDFGSISHFDPADQQQHTLFAVVDYNGKPNSIEFGIGHGFTSASDKLVLKLMVIHDF